MPAKLGTFRVMLLPSIAYTKELKRMFDQLNGNKSAVIRDAILEMANNRGFDLENEIIAKPDYLTEKQWQLFVNSQKLRKSVNYDYFIAFYWLKALPDFRYASSGVLLRLALTHYLKSLA